MGAIEDEADEENYMRARDYEDIEDVIRNLQQKFRQNNKYKKVVY